MGYFRNKGSDRKNYPRRFTGSRRGQSVLGIFLMVFLVAVMAAGVVMIYKMYDQKDVVKKGTSSTKKSDGRKGNGGKSREPSGGSDSGDNKVSAEYTAAIAAYKVLLSKNITRATGKGFDVSVDSRSGSGTGSGSGAAGGSGTGTGSGSGSDADSGAAAGTGNGTESSADGTGSGTEGTGIAGSGTDSGTAAAGTDLDSGSGTDSGTDLNSGTGTDSGSGTGSGSGSAGRLDAEEWKPENCEFALVFIDSDDIPELLVYNTKDAYHITGYGELYAYDKDSPTHVKALMALSLDDLTDLGYYRKTGWYMDHYASAGSGKVSLKNIRESGKNRTVISKVLQSAGGDRYEVAGYEISNGKSNSRQLNQTEYNDKVAEVTGGIPMTKYVFYKNTQESREKYLK